MPTGEQSCSPFLFVQPKNKSGDTNDFITINRWRFFGIPVRISNNVLHGSSASAGLLVSHHRLGNRWSDFLSGHPGSRLYENDKENIRMNYQHYIADALELVAAWDLPTEDFAQAVNDQAKIMAGLDLELLTDAPADCSPEPLQF